MLGKTKGKKMSEEKQEKSIEILKERGCVVVKTITVTEEITKIHEEIKELNKKAREHSLLMESVMKDGLALNNEANKTWGKIKKEAIKTNQASLAEIGSNSIGISIFPDENVVHFYKHECNHDNIKKSVEDFAKKLSDKGIDVVEVVAGGVVGE